MPKVAVAIDPARLAQKIAIDDPLTKAELREWQGWGHSTVDRYVALGMEVIRRPGARDFYQPSKVIAFKRGETAQRPAPKRGRPRLRRA